MNTQASPAPLFVTPADLARMLAISPSKVGVLIREGKIQTIQVGKRRRVPSEEVHRILAQGV
ncbi:excisionase family DNA binding protein [Rhodoblastus acidophilus]|uniref:helix-turn-helix domain-containing protein n=1 Tax=Rhodoblastus acidophilus TaxID=1074 RepID=UPI002225AA6A|nr:helix-turn-helix domain-containing protein [Rhodoblastus acidophilus]MCW2285682.1 excisionase family DNA binding protein [Rhodoblastus acidophilus]MCW2333054.1 excisionase family DNA binding protein [Rhodoblastus acidophilus]